MSSVAIFSRSKISSLFLAILSVLATSNAHAQATTPFVRASYVPEFNGGALRELMDFHADQVQMTIASKNIGGVSVSAPEDTELVPSASANKGSAIGSLAGGESCSADQFGDVKCQEN